MGGTYRPVPWLSRWNGLPCIRTSCSRTGASPDWASRCRASHPWSEPMHPRVKGVEVVPPYGLRLTFRDGSTGVVDGSRWLDGADDTVFAALRDPVFFARVYVDQDAGTIAWPNAVDPHAAVPPDARNTLPTSRGVAPSANSARSRRSTETEGSADSILATRDWLDFRCLASAICDHRCFVRRARRPRLSASLVSTR